MRGFLLAGLAVLLSLPLAETAQARNGAAAVDAELVFAVDISRSMDEAEQRLQRAGYVAALTSPAFLNALKSGPTGKVAITYLEWSDSYDQEVLLPWALIDSPETARLVADKLGEAPFRRASRTSISGGIDAAAHLFDNNGFSSDRQVIDVSGDGPNNNGRPVTAARDDAVGQGITINGLPLVGIRPYRSYGDIPNLDQYYQDCVIGGSDAFMVVIRSTKDFVDATRTKLVREIASSGPAPDAPRIMRVAGESATACELAGRQRF